MKDDGSKANKGAVTSEAKEPSLFEQLFPDQQQQPEVPQEQPQQVPRLPTDPINPISTTDSHDTSRRDRSENYYLSPKAKDRFREVANEELPFGPEVSVLVLRNASKNLVEDDFRRLIPRGRHMEGWRLEQGDIMKHIPGRNWKTLERENYHYLLFSSALSAFTYQGHATRVFQLVAQHTPRNMLSPILPPPGEMVKGIDANEAIESFTLAPPNASLDLHQLKPPLTPMVKSIVKHRGYSHLLRREERMPFEARLTLEGPQLHGSSIIHLFMFSGQDRGLSWSGNDDPAPKVTEWRPDLQLEAPSPLSNRPDDVKRMHELDRGAVKTPQDIGHRNDDGLKRRTLQKVYIIGFHTENAMQSFVHFWHKRPMQWKGLNKHLGVGDEGDLPAVAHVEAL